MQGFFAQMQGGVFTADFFTPEDDVFGSLDDDRPAFAVGTWIRNGSSPTNPTPLHMYVWDRRDHREVTILAAHGLIVGTSHAAKLVTDVANMIKENDPKASVTLAV